MSGETFGAMLRRLRVERGLSQNQLARQAGIDPAYVNRMERAGQQTKGGRVIREEFPRRPLVLALALVLDISQSQADRLLLAAGLAPQEDWQSRAVRAETALDTIRGALDDLSFGDSQPTMIRSRAV